ncbi:MAG: tryptophan-rich sensory protein [Candidatus Riflemargulisbacteria bacterium]
MKNKKFIMVNNILSFFFMFMLNALANILPINGYYTGQLSDMYPNLFVPAGITFSIWGLIYIALILFIGGMYKLKGVDDAKYFKLSLLFIVSNLLNGYWILAWHYKFVFLSLIIMLALLATLIQIFLVVKSIKVKTTSLAVKFISSATSLYLGWISVATVANFSAFLVHVGWNRFGFSEVSWTIAIIVVVLLLTIVMLIKEKDIVFSLVVLWAYLGIVIKRLAVTPIYYEIVMVTEVAMVIIVIFVVLMFFEFNKKRVK